MIKEHLHRKVKNRKKSIASLNKNAGVIIRHKVFIALFVGYVDYLQRKSCIFKTVAIKGKSDVDRHQRFVGKRLLTIVVKAGAFDYINEFFFMVFLEYTSILVYIFTVPKRKIVQ